MDIFFHHVGQEGSKEDFKKTVYAQIDIDFVNQNLPDNDKNKKELMKSLSDNFPSGKFNCWGVPAGARIVIKNLKSGDYVFLVESSSVDGSVPALCPVKLFWPTETRELSTALWGKEKFPYIFFFDTERLDLMWIQFLEDLDYKTNFSPRGNFYKINPNRFEAFGGTGGYINHVLSHYLAVKHVTDNQVKISFSDDIQSTISDIKSETDRLIQQSLNEPVLTDNTNKRNIVKETPRDAAFAVSIKKIYNYKCAICEKSLKSPKGKYEVQAAHIYPKSKNGSDDLRNGICLCHLHHWAFDAGMISISNDYTVIVKADIPEDEEYQCITKWKDKKILLPKDSRFNPHPIYLNASRRLNNIN